MPLALLKHLTPEAQLAIWEIDEPAEKLTEWLGPLFPSDPQPSSSIDHVVSQWAASRLCLKMLLGYLPELVKSNEGAPSPKDGTFTLSLTHTRGWAAALVAYSPCGIDLETLNDRAWRIRERFTDEAEWPLAPGATNEEKALWVWCAKEAAFKQYGLGGVLFKDDLRVDFSSPNPFMLNHLNQSRIPLMSMRIKEALVTCAISMC